MEGETNSQEKGKGCGCGCLSSVSTFITNSLEGFFYWLGFKVGRHPLKTILIVVIISGACAVGMLKFKEESDGTKLWVPQDSLAVEHQQWVGEKFPSKTLFTTIMVTAPNVLTPAVFGQLLELDRKIKELKNGTASEWKKICYRIGPVCFVSNVLELWSYNAAVIKNLTQEQILSKINQQGLRSPITGRKVSITAMLGELKRSSDDKITSAGAVKVTYGIQKDEEGEVKGENWEKEVSTTVKSWKSDVLKNVYLFNTYSFRDDAGSAISGDVTFLSAGYMLIIAYVAFMLGNLTRLRQKIWLAILGVISVGLAIGVSFGLSSAFGEMYGPVHSTLPFLLLGIGVDDMFVIVQSWNNISPHRHKTLSVEERTALALKHAGCSITITSLTDFMAFMIGATTVLPALKSFCIFAGIGILADFFIQATFFTACVALDAKRQESKRDACCCCIKLSDSYAESLCGARDRMKEFFGSVYSKVVLSLPGKVTTMVITAVLLGFNLYGTLMLRQYFDQIWFFPPDSMSYKYTSADNKYFPVDGESAAIYTGKLDYFANQIKLQKVHDIVIKDEYVVGTSMVSWYEEYRVWAKTNKPSSFFDEIESRSRIKNETLFYSWLNEYLAGVGKTFAGDVKLKNASSGLTILASRMSFKHKDMDTTQTEVKAMDQLRRKIKDIYSDEMSVFSYGRRYINWETNKIIQQELYRNVALAMAVVFLVTLVVIANLWTSLMVLTCIVLTLVNVGGLMHFWGLTIDTVTTILLVLAVGLAVDYASHIAHSFMVTAGTRQERAHITLRDMGPAVFNGGFSTFLAFILLVASNSYVFKTFFKVFFAVVLFGLFHGLCYLPVLLSAIGPSPYESARDHKSEKQHGSGRSSPVHPVSGQDNKGLEIQDKNIKDTQPNGYNIPTPDYHDVNMEDFAKKI
ncbi:patched domain-containing protein 3 [Exaiptasia diaphana]|uniref:SSD domain-containing protein n=1 Tax=Exaiptasia diaphana TaxID=2652724 RepID=A0A913X1R0_EXADI|nr:patched domain-containing protein 3 [Exaiptasia diaphana]XP_020897535.1 patched domain-containing protein 3 [Exaiptasia diaphana]KXJ16057.1 Patched domain-containing protein 3 [Exaiptasia diaphana]